VISVAVSHAQGTLRCATGCANDTGRALTAAGYRSGGGLSVSWGAVSSSWVAFRVRGLPRR